MRFFPWVAEELELLIPQVDREHEELVELMNQLHECHHLHAPREKVEAVLDELIAKTEQHFKNEEKFMLSIGYPAYDNHRRIHLKLMDRLTSHAVRFKTINETLEEDFFIFLRVWLTAHIQGIDRLYANHMRGVLA